MARKIHSNFLTLLAEKELREKRRIKAIEIAEATGIAPSTVGRWLHDDVYKFEAAVLEAFCDYFNCGLADLLILEEV
ncbi:MAG: helix-turn-helix transcriptional regulator [Chitinophagaceae bacterium]|nr:helix-turn-helix transcriptional regulator [Anaerolineae bacterium]